MSHSVNDPALPTVVTVGCANFDSVPGDKDATVDKMIAVMGDASQHGCDLVVFPETALNSWGGCDTCAEGGRPCDWHRAEAERADGPSAQRLLAAAADLGLHVIYGFEEAGDAAGTIHNSASLLAPDGLVGTYRKVHLGIPLETDRFTPGDQLPVFETALGPIAISICYDFYNNPELARIQCLKGARLLVNPTGRGDLPRGRENLTQATLVRAQENLVYAASANRCGNSHGKAWAGGSVIGGPEFPGFGVALATAGTGEELVVASLDFDQLAQWYDWLPWREWRLGPQMPVTELVSREFAALAGRH